VVEDRKHIELADVEDELVDAGAASGVESEDEDDDEVDAVDSDAKDE